MYILNYKTPKATRTVQPIKVYFPIINSQNNKTLPKYEMENILKDINNVAKPSTRTNLHTDSYSIGEGRSLTPVYAPHIASKKHSEYSNFLSDFPLILQKNDAPKLNNGRNSIVRKRAFSSTNEIIMSLNRGASTTLATCCSIKERKNRSYFSIGSKKKFVELKSTHNIGLSKFKAIIHKSVAGDCFSDTAIEKLKEEIYQKRYVLYVNNHNILNNMKQFLADNMPSLPQKQIDTILRLISVYHNKIEREELRPNS